MLFHARIRRTETDPVLYGPSVLVQLSAQKESGLQHIYSGRNIAAMRQKQRFSRAIAFDTDVIENFIFYSTDIGVHRH
jgi:hypothetical protein